MFIFLSEFGKHGTLDTQRVIQSQNFIFVKNLL